MTAAFRVSVIGRAFAAAAVIALDIAAFIVTAAVATLDGEWERGCRLAVRHLSLRGYG